MCGLAACSRCGRQAWAQRKLPRALTCCIRSKRFIGVSSVPRSQMALALLTRMSMPPKASTVAATAARTWSSSRMSHFSARPRPPAAFTASAAEWMVPGSFGFGTADLAAMATLAPSRAARRAMARPMPREAPVMNRVLPAREVMSGVPCVREAPYATAWRMGIVDRLHGRGHRPGRMQASVQDGAAGGGVDQLFADLVDITGLGRQLQVVRQVLARAGQVAQFQVGHAAVAHGLGLLGGQREHPVDAACGAIPFTGLGVQAMQV